MYLCVYIYIYSIQRKREQAITDTVDVTLSGQVPSSGVVSQSGKPPSSVGDTDAGNNKGRSCKQLM